MDRALGALSTTPGDLKSCGLYYQWGRKDPFPGIGQDGGGWAVAGNPIKVYDASGTPYSMTVSGVPSNAIPNNLTNATRNPVTFYYGVDWFVNGSGCNDDLWSGRDITLTTPAEKSVFDPCPDGWRIAPFLNSTSPFARMDGGSTWGNNGRTWPGTGGYFPASGAIGSSNGRVESMNILGTYWLGSPNSIYARYLTFKLESVNPTTHCGRPYGYPVRCTQDNL